MLTGLYPRDVMSLALADGPLPGEVLVLDLHGGFLHVMLREILKRKTPRQHLPKIYEPTQDHYRVPLPLEVTEPLRNLLAQCQAEPTGPDRSGGGAPAERRRLPSAGCHGEESR